MSMTEAECRRFWRQIGHKAGELCQWIQDNSPDKDQKIVAGMIAFAASGLLKVAVELSPEADQKAIKKNTFKMFQGRN